MPSALPNTVVHDVTSHRIAAVDILRALAALFVLVYHARAEFWVGMRATLESPSLSLDTLIALLLWPFSLGWLGVPIFFLLSGYCIHLRAARKLACDEELQFRFQPYIWRRILRIYPVLLAALILTAILDWVQSGIPIKQYIADNAWFFIVNLLSLQELLAPAFSFNTVLWTISIELHLYVFYPVVLWIILWKGPTVALAASATISIVTAVAYFSLDLKSVFVHAHGGSPLFSSHLLIWVAGAYLAEVHTGRAYLPRSFFWNLVWLVSLTFGIVLQVQGHWGVSPLFLALGSFGAVDAAFRIIGRYSIDKMLTGLVLEKIGIMSYSLYATHRITFEALIYSGLADRHASIIPTIGYCFIAIAAAYIFFLAIERLTLH